MLTSQVTHQWASCPADPRQGPQRGSWWQKVHLCSSAAGLMTFSLFCVLAA